LLEVVAAQPFPAIGSTVDRIRESSDRDSMDGDHDVWETRMSSLADSSGSDFSANPVTESGCAHPSGRSLCAVSMSSRGWRRSSPAPGRSHGAMPRRCRTPPTGWSPSPVARSRWRDRSPPRAQRRPRGRVRCMP
jgi:hypothetical protein